jgi:hypothetical protein
MEAEFARLGGQARVTTLLLNSMADATRNASIEAGKAMPLFGPGNELGAARFEIGKEAVGLVKAQQRLVTSALDGMIAEVTEKNRKLVELLAKPVGPESFSKDLGVGLLGGQSTQALAEWQMRQPVFLPKVDERAAQELKRLNEEGRMTADIMATIGDSVGSAFGSIGEMIGGAAGTFVSVMGRMIQQAVQLAISLAAASVAWTSPLGMVAIGSIALAGLLGLIGSVPSFDVGTLSVPKTGLAMIHRGETILPAGGPAEAYRAGLARIGGQGSGGSTTVNVNMNISALDGQSVYRTLNGSRDQLARVVREAVRDGVMG